MVSRQDVVMAYRLLLGREPENEEVIAGHTRTAPDLRALRQIFLCSEEFTSHANHLAMIPPYLDLGAPLRVDVDVDQDLARKMLSRVEDTWQRLGNQDPYWSVLSWDDHKQAGSDSAELADEFHESGKREVDRLLAWLKRNGATISGPGRSCCEYGCGTGRVTRWLAAQFGQVAACDISQAHLDLARHHLDRMGVSNVRFHRIESLRSLGALEPVELIFSFYVLQHNPPPLMALILTGMLQLLKPGGAAFFQLPTYRTGYRFAAEEYLDQPPAEDFEMHVLPQKYVYAIAAQQGCEVLEVAPDGFVGSPQWISMTFLLRKRGPV